MKIYTLWRTENIGKIVRKDLKKAIFSSRDIAAGSVLTASLLYTSPL